MYGLLAELVVVAHLGFLAFLAVGGLLAWRWPWVAWPHLPAVGWGVAAVTVGVDCPLTALEKHFRKLSGQGIYPGGFIDHYLTDVIYPGSLTWLVRALVAAAVLVGYAGLLAGRRSRTRARRSGAPGAPGAPGASSVPSTPRSAPGRQQH